PFHLSSAVSTLPMTLNREDAKRIMDSYLHPAVGHFFLEKKWPKENFQNRNARFDLHPHVP
ncbi:MAG TPA: hypothetical protein VNL69_09515, partial [Bacteroidota bacterium]|nr:hypothetical protein [Bacteroidota bacterium]